MAEPVEVEQVVEVPEVPKEEKAQPKLEELPKEAPEEITLQTPDGPITFAKKKPVGRPKKDQPKKEPKARAKKVVVKAPEEIPPPPEESAPPEKENYTPPEPTPLVRMSGREKLDEHMRIMQELRVSAKESQRVKYRAMLRA